MLLENGGATQAKNCEKNILNATKLMTPPRFTKSYALVVAPAFSPVRFHFHYICFQCIVAYLSTCCHLGKANPRGFATNDLPLPGDVNNEAITY